ncbi:MAG: hypothetical protein ABIN94_11415 [Ferruginibacter sp.]
MDQFKRSMKFTAIILLAIVALAVSRKTHFIFPDAIIKTETKDLEKLGTFSYTIAGACRASAGVYANDSILVRTLWNNIEYSAGKYTGTWDGNDDRGKPVSSGPVYTIKLVTNNVKYSWQGTIGNTSDSMTGSTKHNGYYNCMTGLVFSSNGYGYFCTGYSEGKSSYYKLLTAAPQRKIDLYANFNGRIITLSTEFVATDNINVYWAGYDSYANLNSMVHAIRAKDDANIKFAAGTEYKMKLGAVTLNAISKLTSPNAHISGLAVQRNGQYLFVSRAGINELQVLNKTSGALVHTLSIKAARGVCVDGNDNLWIISDTNSVSQYKVNNDGTLGPPKLTLPQLVEPLAIQVSPDNKLIAVAEGGTHQQVKFFNNLTGTFVNSKGAEGGYLNDPTVNNDKFYLNSSNTSGDARLIAFIAWQANGSYWVNDPGNFRVQHYDRGGAFINGVMSLGSTYNVYADPNNPTRVWAGPLEFAIDYKAPLSGSSGWTLAKNWGATISNEYSKSNFYFPTTLTNKRTYALINKRSKGNNREIVEFPATGPLRFTGIYRNGSLVIAPDGALQTINKAALGGTTTVYRYGLTGFTSNGNPEWSIVPELLATTPPLTIDDPNDVITGNVLTSTNRVIIWNPDVGVNATIVYPGYHLGAIARGGNSWLFKTELATHKKYQGPYPNAGRFDIGNNVHLGGGTLSILGRNLVTSYHGEFWKNAQTNMYNHYLDNGLAIGQFGVTRETAKGNAPAMYAGNALTPMLVADPSSSNAMYLYHGDEAAHSGVHRWKISGLNTIKEQDIPLQFSASAAKANIDYIDLMEQVPFNSVLLNNTAGWTRYPDEEINIHQYANHWKVNTSVLKYEGSPDIYVNFAQPQAATYTVSKDLGDNKILKTWKITGTINFGSMLNGHSNNAYLDVLDNKGKLLTTLYATISGKKVHGNEAIIADQSAESKSFEISVSSGMANFSYGGSKRVKTTLADRSADWSRPASLRLRFVSNGGMPNYNLRFDISDLKFYKSD